MRAARGIRSGMRPTYRVSKRKITGGNTMLRFIKGLITKRFILAIILLLSCFAISCSAIWWSHYQVVAIISFASSIVAIIRTVLCRVGEIPLFSIDRTWNLYRFARRSKGDNEEGYKEMSLCIAAVFTILTFAFVLVLFILEIVWVFLL